jgi:hypothetical protein
VQFNFTQLPPPSAEESRNLVEMVKAASSYIHLVTPHWTERKKEVGTAVALRAKDRLFAITADHCAESGVTLFFERGEGEPTRSRILRKHTQPPLDVALLELEYRPDVAACHLEQLCFEPLEATTSETQPTLDKLFWAIGFPVERATVSKDDALSAHMCVFASNLIQVTPTELTLYYHRDGTDIGLGRPTTTVPLPESPKGFSGCGIWRLNWPADDGLFNPLRHVSLHGIQHSWISSTRLLRCVPIRVVGELLFREYPELREHLPQFSLPSERG